MEDGPVAGVTIALDGHGQLFALATRKAIDALGLKKGGRVFALVKTVALDERALASAATHMTAADERRYSIRCHPEFLEGANVRG